jgi:hypothetical protein
MNRRYRVARKEHDAHYFIEVEEKYLYIYPPKWRGMWFWKRDVSPMPETCVRLGFVQPWQTDEYRVAMNHSSHLVHYAPPLRAEFKTKEEAQKVIDYLIARDRERQAYIGPWQP